MCGRNGGCLLSLAILAPAEKAKILFLKFDNELTCSTSILSSDCTEHWYTAISRKVVGQNVHKTIPKGNMGYDQYSVPDFVAVQPTFVAFLQHSQTYVHSLACHSILTFFEEQLPQNHPQYLSGLSSVLFPTTFLEIAVYLDADRKRFVSGDEK